MTKEVLALKSIIKKSNDIVFLGGAGVSTASGIPDFRSNTGLYSTNYKNYSPEEVLSHNFFINNTEIFYDYYFDNMVFPSAKPNDAHLSLAKLEKRGKLKAIITQNIDGLHQLAGSKNVIELHGSILKNKCMDCDSEYPLSYVLKSNGIPRCKCGGLIKPKVVLYGENLDEDAITLAIRNVCSADVLIVGGTSLLVNPAASFVRYFKGTHFVIINKTPTPYDYMADLIIREPIDKVLKEAVKR